MTGGRCPTCGAGDTVPLDSASGQCLWCLANALRAEVVRLRANTWPSLGARMIADERDRQIKESGYTEAHDDEHRQGELAIAAAQLAVDGTDEAVSDFYASRDVWGLIEKHKADRTRQLIIAGALLAAEVDRRLRALLAKEGE